MSARANAPVFQLHPSATGAGLSSPSQVPVIPTPVPHGFTPANAAQLIPSPPPISGQHHQPPPPLSQGPLHGYHHRADGGLGKGRRRNSSFSQRRTDPRTRASMPPHMNQPLPQIHATSAEDLVSGARTAPVPDVQFSTKREGESSSHNELYHKRRREEDYAGPSRLEPEPRSQVARSPDRASQRSGTGSVISMKRESEEAERAYAIPTPPASTAP
jgi:hypothetical protein